MADQRMVGSAMRRRMGAKSSHLGMAQGWDPDPIAKASVGEATKIVGGGLNRQGGRSHGTMGHTPGVADDYSTGNAAGGGDPALSRVGDIAEFVSEVSAVRQNEPHPPRGRIYGGGNARLTVSPSMKVAEESPAPTQFQGKVVPTGRGRSMGTFDAGAAEVQSR